jgi:hypothetical protein
MADLVDLSGQRCLLVAQDGPPLRTVSHVVDLIGDALSEGATVVAVPVSALDPSFFDLRSGFAGDVLQKAANYGIKFAVVGDVAEHAAASNAFRDLVVESRRSTSFFFEPELELLASRLAQPASR